MKKFKFWGNQMNQFKNIVDKIFANYTVDFLLRFFYKPFYWV